jgi:hypothetical protein
VNEWPSLDRSTRLYSPRLDLAVGPFSTTRGGRQGAAYRQLADQHRQFLDDLWACHVANETRLNAHDDLSAATLDNALEANRNARCFLAIEIENAVSRKHLMGGAINAAALGHIGLLIGWSEEKVRAMFRTRGYLHFLRSVDKPSMPVGNLLILSRAQALAVFGTPRITA